MESCSNVQPESICDKDRSDQGPSGSIQLSASLVVPLQASPLKSNNDVSCRVVPDRSVVPLEKRCKPLSLQSGDSGDWKSQKPIDGWEFIDKCRTCDYYPIDANLPGRFNNPAWFKGYGCEKPSHPFYSTTSSELGRFGPNPHTMTQMYYPRSSAFTEVLAVTGMYRNRTLNTSNNKTIV